MLLRRYFWCQFHSNNFKFKFKHGEFKLLRRYLGQFHWNPKVECFASDTAPHLTLLLLTQWPHPFSCNNWSKNLLTLTTLMYNLEISFRFWGVFSLHMVPNNNFPLWVKYKWPSTSTTIFVGRWKKWCPSIAQKYKPIKREEKERRSNSLLIFCTASNSNLGNSQTKYFPLSMKS